MCGECFPKDDSCGKGGKEKKEKLDANSENEEKGGSTTEFILAEEKGKGGMGTRRR